MLIILIIAGGVAYYGNQQGRFSAGETENQAGQEEITNPLANTSRTLREFDGQAVNGDYRLDFSDTSVSTQLCNSIGGEYTVANDTIQGVFFQTQMACIDEEKSLLENAFDLNGATFTIASTRMIGENAERLAITTVAGDVFTYATATVESVEVDFSTPNAQDELNAMGPTLHPSWDIDGDGINDCEKEGICDDLVDYSQPRVNPEESLLGDIPEGAVN